jgi:hypothetical protein
LAQYARVTPFEPEARLANGFRGVVAFKHRGDYQTYETPSVYFKWLDKGGENARERGFYDVSNGEDIGAISNNKYASTTAEDGKLGYARLYSHVAKFSFDGQWFIVIQGISGPSSLGLAQLLTGAQFRQFTAFGDDATTSRAMVVKLRNLASADKDPWLQEFYGNSANVERIPDVERYSEDMVKKLNDVFVKSNSVEAVVRVFVCGSPSTGDAKEGGADDHDERRVLWWQYALGPRAIAKP